jgi:hypothetical protein
MDNYLVLIQTACKNVDNMDAFATKKSGHPAVKTWAGSSFPRGDILRIHDPAHEYMI